LAEQVTDERLLEQAANGDGTAFQVLYERYRDAIFRFAYRLVGSVESAEDVTHDCFLSLIKEPGRFDPARASLRTYLYAAARNLAVKQFNYFSRAEAIDGLAEEPSVSNNDHPMRRVLDSELSVQVENAIAGLPPLQREALVLFEYEDLSLAEVAAVVGTDVGTVKSRLFRARETLRLRLARYFRIDSEAVRVEDGFGARARTN
jgi:RNA polymerase sigma-70 factor, ECF subfamily